MPLPESLYSSPLRRAASTLHETWHDILLIKGVIPHVSAAWRVRISQPAFVCHVADGRSKRRYERLSAYTPVIKGATGASLRRRTVSSEQLIVLDNWLTSSRLDV